jgi:hypothetical protein
VRTMKKIATVGLATAGLVAGGALPAATAATPGYVSMWEDSNYGGDRWVHYAQGTIQGDRFEIHWWDGDNEISSLQNGTNKWLVVYDKDAFGGERRCIAPGREIRNMKDINFNDKAESFELMWFNPCA